MVDNSTTKAPATLAVVLIGRHPRWVEAIVDHFRRDEVSIALVDNCFEAIDIVERTQPGFIAIDVDEIGAEILGVCRRSRAVCDAHITLCYRGGGEKAIVAGFAAGADDVLTGSRSSRELAARVRVVLRRRKTLLGLTTFEDVAPQRITCGPLVVDAARREIHIAGDRIHLTRIQFDILVELAKRGGAVTTHEELVNAVWGPRWNGNRDSVTVHIRQLRQRLGDGPERPVFLVNVRGIGYRLVPAAKT